jgi:hypothetical protein
MGRKLALLIGNGRYDDPGLAGLPTADVDVREIAEVLRTPEVGEFDEVIELADQGLARVRRSITEFFSRAKKDDLLVLYFSGHGVKDQDGRLYLAVRDTELPLLVGTSIEAAFITAQMDRSYSKRQVIILDCCHSGAFAHGAKAGEAQPVGIGPAFEGTGYGHVVLTATDSMQYAWEGDRIIGDSDKSVFTHYLLQGLRTGDADTDRDGLITIDEIYEYVFEHVIRETPKQTPGKWSYKQQGEIVIARNPHLVKPAPLPLELQALLDSPLARLRVEAVPELATLAEGPHRGLALAARAALERLRADDSRKVSAAAEEVLAKLSEPPPVLDPTPVVAEQTPVVVAEPALIAPEALPLVPSVRPSEIDREAIERAQAEALEMARAREAAQPRVDDLLRQEDLALRATPVPEPGDDDGRGDVKEGRRPWFLSPGVRLGAAVVIVAVAVGVSYGIWGGPSTTPEPAVVKEPAAPVPDPPAPKPQSETLPQDPPTQKQESGPPSAPADLRVEQPPIDDTPKPDPSIAKPPSKPPQRSRVDVQIQQLLALGESSMQAREYDSAIEAFDNAARLGSKVGQTRADDARQQKAQRDADLKAQRDAQAKAQQDAQLKAQQDAQQARQRLDQAAVLMDKGDYEQSLRLIQEAMKLDPKNPEAASLQRKVIAARDFERKLP